MATLRETQARLFALITAPESVTRTLATAGLTAAHVEALVVGDARRDAVGRLEIYANMYFFRLLAALRDYYPALAAALGEARFHNLVLRYLEREPSREPSLRHLGRRLPELVAEAPAPLARDEAPWLAELAALERARLDCFDAADEASLTLDDVRARAATGELVTLPLRLVAAQRRLPCAYAVDEAWRRLTGDAEPAGEVTAQPSPRTILVWRRGVDVLHRALADDEARALALVASGCSFGALCEALADAGDAEAAAARAFALSARWFADTLIAA